MNRVPRGRSLTHFQQQWERMSAEEQTAEAAYATLLLNHHLGVWPYISGGRTRFELTDDQVMALILWARQDGHAHDPIECGCELTPADAPRPAPVASGLDPFAETEADGSSPIICQVANPADPRLTCPAESDGGYRCEVQGPHDKHGIGDHTVKHALAGNGYACSAIGEEANG